MAEIFFDTREDTDEIIRALGEEGYQWTLRQEAFAGEDDSEDRSWVLTVEPFDDAVIELVDVYGGWMPGDTRLPEDQLDLPDGPRRH